MPPPCSILQQPVLLIRSRNCASSSFVVADANRTIVLGGGNLNFAPITRSVVRAQRSRSIAHTRFRPIWYFLRTKVNVTALECSPPLCSSEIEWTRACVDCLILTSLRLPLILLDWGKNVTSNYREHLSESFRAHVSRIGNNCCRVKG